ncbi:transposase [Vibrio neonatus]|uniref:transposase n=1 Tax=Vibrio neonatus TaxID=278860 RepID=UPI0021C34DD1|nr:transposase [Vibrio neonatus]
MTTARKQLVSIDATPYYHCVSRCVRQSYLCGHDYKKRTCYNHRKQWVEQKLIALTYCYCIDVCAYAIMSNHYHLVLYINKNKALALSQLEVVERWSLDHKLPLLIKRWLRKELTNRAEEEKCNKIIELWRKRLWDLSWFMKDLNFEIACKANREDNCKGHFWESRFKSQALLDDQALLAAMAYVDLNPIRASTAKMPEASEYTSIKARLDALGNGCISPNYLCPFIGHSSNETQSGIPFKLMDYIELVDWTAQEFREGKASIDHTLPPILQRLSFDQQHWIKVCTHLERRRTTAISTRLYQIEHAKLLLGKSKIHMYWLN